MTNGFIEMSAQNALYNALGDDVELSSLANGIYDHVPESESKPYVVIGDITAEDWSTMGNRGQRMLCTVHTWTEYAGLLKARQIMERVHIVLNLKSLSISGFNHAGTRLQYSHVMTEADGKTQHGVQRFVLYADEE